MKYSWNWIEEYIDLSDLDKNELGELLAVRSLEVEEVTPEYIDIDVTPNRASDCLSHWGVARELGAILKREVKKTWSVPAASQYDSDLLDGEFVNQFSVLRIDNVQVGSSPEPIQKRLETLGLKPI